MPESGTSKPPSIGPTSLPQLRRCALSVALKRVVPRSERLPASHPATFLGNIHHDLLERTRRGEAGDPPDAARLSALWEGCVSSQEQKLRGGPNGRWVPLKKHARTMERARIRTIREASLISPTASGPANSNRSSSATGAAPRGIRKRGPEVELFVPIDGWEICGQVDLIEDLPSGGIRITDFKTGGIHNIDGSVKSDYIGQLVVYAGLLSEQHGEQATRLRLADARGFKEDLTRHLPSVAQVLADAKLQVAEFAAKWPTGASDVASIVASYPGTPSQDACRSCSYRSHCPAYDSLLASKGINRMGPDYAPNLTVDVTGQVVSHTQNGARHAVTLDTPAGAIHIRGELGIDPAIGQTLKIFGVTPSPNSRRIRNADAAPPSDYVTYSGSRITLANTPASGGGPASTVAEAPPPEPPPPEPVEVKTDDVVLQVRGGKGVSRTTWVDGRKHTEWCLESHSMPVSHQAVAATIIELRRMANGNPNPHFIWCTTPEGVTWLDDFSAKKIAKITGAETWHQDFLELFEYWSKLKRQGRAVVRFERDHPRFPAGTAAVVYLDGMAKAGVAKPVANINEATDFDKETRSGPVGMPEASSLRSDVDIEVHASVSGPRGPGELVMTMCSERARSLALEPKITSTAITTNALTFLGLLNVAKAVVDSELTDVRIRCGNDTAITWFGNRSMGKAKTGGHDPETLEQIRHHLAWLDVVARNNDYKIRFIRKNQASVTRPSVTIERGNQIVLHAGF